QRCDSRQSATHKKTSKAIQPACTARDGNQTRVSRNARSSVQGTSRAARTRTTIGGETGRANDRRGALVKTSYEKIVNVICRGRRMQPNFRKKILGLNVHRRHYRLTEAFRLTECNKRKKKRKLQVHQIGTRHCSCDELAPRLRDRKSHLAVALARQ